MRTLKKNKQKMFYALYKGAETVYELDDNGNKIIDYVDEDGNVYYRESGTEQLVYNEPIEFKASISSNLNEMHAREYGVDKSSIYSEITCEKGYLPLEYGSKIWRTSNVEWIDEELKIPDVSSSDYTVMGILDEFQDYDFYLLQRNNKETK